MLNSNNLHDQDDSAMNRKMMARIIDGEIGGSNHGGGGVGGGKNVDGSSSTPRLPQQACLLEADDGTVAVEILRSEMAAGRRVDMILMDFVMVRFVLLNLFNIYHLYTCLYILYRLR